VFFYNYLCCFVESKIQHWPRYTDSWFLFKMAATPFLIPRNTAAILNLEKVLLWAACDPCIPRIYQRINLVQICQELAKIYSLVYFPKRRPPLSWISEKCYFGPLHCRYLSAYKMWCILITNWPKYALYVFSMMAAATILNSQNVWTTVDTCIAVPIPTPNLVQIDQELAEMHPYVYFSRWRPWPSWISKKMLFCNHRWHI